MARSKQKICNEVGFMIEPINKKLYLKMLMSTESDMTGNYNPSKTDKDTLQITKSEFPWVINPIITSALDELRKVKFNPYDIEYLKNMGLEIPFKSGEEAVKFIKSSNLRIDFNDTGA
ncbi:hypothetical protein IJS77_01500, partial [bacterium]|nr:hypothetical protein [bacterium]